MLGPGSYCSTDKNIFGLLQAVWLRSVVHSIWLQTRLQIWGLIGPGGSNGCRWSLSSSTASDPRLVFTVFISSWKIPDLKQYMWSWTNQDLPVWPMFVINHPDRSMALYKLQPRASNIVLWIITTVVELSLAWWMRKSVLKYFWWWMSLTIFSWSIHPSIPHQTIVWVL